jgi:hypothetical protein
MATNPVTPYDKTSDVFIIQDQTTKQNKARSFPEVITAHKSTTAQAQAGTDDTTIITPLKLNDGVTAILANPAAPIPAAVTAALALKMNKTTGATTGGKVLIASGTTGIENVESTTTQAQLEGFDGRITALVPQNNLAPNSTTLAPTVATVNQGLIDNRQAADGVSITGTGYQPNPFAINYATPAQAIAGVDGSKALNSIDLKAVTVTTLSKDIVSGVVTGTNLVLTLQDGTTLPPIDVTSLANVPDVKLQSGAYNSVTKALDFTLSNATIVSVPVAALLPVNTNPSISGNGSTTPLTVAFSTDANNSALLGSDNKVFVAKSIPTTYNVAVSGLPNYTGTINPAYDSSVTAYQSNYIYNVTFDSYSDGQPIFIDLGFGTLPLKKSNPDNKLGDILANQIVQNKQYTVIFNPTDNNFTLIGETGNLVSINEKTAGLPSALVSYTVFKNPPFDGQMLEAWFDVDSAGSDTLDVGFGPSPIVYTDLSNLNTPILGSMIRKNTRYLFVWNSDVNGWNIINYATAPIPTNVSQLVNDTGFITAADIVAKQDVASKATISQVAGTTTTSRKLRVNDQGANSDTNIDDFFSVVPTKDATGKIVLPIPATEFVTAGTAIDALGDKTGAIARTGKVNIGTTTAPVSTLEVNGSFARKWNAVTSSTAITATDTDFGFVVYPAAGATATINLPSPATALFREYLIQLGGDNDTTIVTLGTAAGNFRGLGHQGQTTFLLKHGAIRGVTVKSDGSNWQVTEYLEEKFTWTTKYLATASGATIFSTNAGGLTAGVVNPNVEVFQQLDGNYTGTITLNPNPTVTNVSIWADNSAGFQTSITPTNTDLPYTVNMPSGQGNSIHFEWSDGLWRWRKTPVKQAPSSTANVRYGNTTPVALGTDKKNDTYIRTDTGLSTGVVQSEYVFDGTIWKLIITVKDPIVDVTGVTPLPIIFPITTLPGVPVFTPNVPNDPDTLYRLPDGTLFGSNGTQYIANVPVSSTPNVRYGTVTPTALATDKKNDTYIQNSTGAFGGILTSTWVYDGTNWVNQNPGGGTSSVFAPVAYGTISMGDFNTTTVSLANNVASVSIVSGSGTGIALYQVNFTSPVSSNGYIITSSFISNTGETAAANATIYPIETVNQTVNGFQFYVREAVGIAQNFSLRFKAEELRVISGTAITNSLTSSASSITSTVSGVPAVLTPVAGTITQNLGFDTTGNLVKSPSTANDFYRSGNGTIQPDGVTDTTENISRLGKVGHGILDASTIKGNLEIGGSTVIRQDTLANATATATIPTTATDLDNGKSSIEITQTTTDAVLLFASTNVAAMKGQKFTVINSDLSTHKVSYLGYDIHPNQTCGFTHDGRMWQIDEVGINSDLQLETVFTVLPTATTALNSFTVVPNGIQSSTTSWVEVPGTSFVAPAAGEYAVKYVAYSSCSGGINTPAVGNGFRIAAGSNIVTGSVQTTVPATGRVIPTSETLITNLAANQIDSYTKTVIVKAKVGDTIQLQMNSVIGSQIVYQTGTQNSRLEYAKIVNISGATGARTKRVTQPLSAFPTNNSIAHGLNLATPFNVEVTARDPITGQSIAVRIVPGSQTAGAVNITTPTAFTSAIINVIEIQN